MTDTLKQAVRATGEPIAVVAKAAGIPQPMLHRFMAGEQGLTLRTVEKLAAHLGLTLTPASKSARTKG